MGQFSGARQIFATEMDLKFKEDRIVKGMKAIRSALLAIFASSAVFGQTLPARPEFEVASIKPSAPPGAGQVNVGVQIDGAQVHFSYLSLKDYIQIAYGVKGHQVVGPDWLASERFEIAAKLPSGAEREQVADMLKALLEDRFQLKMHRDSKEFPVYALVVGKGGLKMKESPDNADASDGEGGKGAVNVTATGGRGGVSVNLGKGSYYSFANNRFEAKKLTMAALADSLTRYLDRPVVDMTELKGNYDFILELSPEDYRAMLIRSAIGAGVVLPPEALRALEGVSDNSLFTAAQALGLKLEQRKAPLPVLMIDHMEKAPTAN
jgi:uncharacterized protein (TIGR03435 family)